MPAEEACSACGGQLSKLGEDVSEMLEYIPASFKVIRHVRPKMCCTRCDAIVQAPAPGRPIDRGLAGPGLLAHVLVSKYADHLPLYRQSEIYAREGVDLDRSTLADWVGAASYLLSPLVDQLRKHVLAASKIHADDTPVPVLAPGTGKTKTARLWTYVRDDRPAGSDVPPAVWFTYSEDRKGEHPQAASEPLCRCPAGRCLCWIPSSLWRQDRRSRMLGSCRRKFYDIHVAHGIAHDQRGDPRIGTLYGIEEEIRGQAAEPRCSVRQARARPLLDVSVTGWRRLSRASRASLTPQRPSATRFPAGVLLTRYLDDGCMEIDNQPAERALRVVALGRKNYLFAGSDEGGSYCPSRYLLINRGAVAADREMTELAPFGSSLRVARLQCATPTLG